MTHTRAIHMLLLLPLFHATVMNSTQSYLPIKWTIVKIPLIIPGQRTPPKYTDVFLPGENTAASVITQQQINVLDKNRRCHGNAQDLLHEKK